MNKNVIVFMQQKEKLSLVYKFCVLLALCLPSSFSIALEINAKVDRNSIALSETLTLTVSVDEQVAFSSPSFEELQQNFDVLRQHKSNRYQSMNGKVVSVTEWTLTLGPKREGQLIVPSFEYNGQFSDAIPITVSKAGKKNGAQQDIFLEAGTNKKEAFVQEQIIFTQKLYSAVNLSSFDPQPLQLQGARVELLSEFDYQTRLGNRPYIVVESRYAIYPQQSGTLVIPSLKWSVGVSGGRRNIFDPFANNSGRIHRLASEAISLNIQPSPTNANPWLPASQLDIKQSWSTDPQAMRIGEPITRHIEISAHGLTAAQLPTIDLNDEASLRGRIKSYLEQPQTEDEKNNDGIIGKRRISTALIPSEAGPLTLPAINIEWWNTQRKQWQTATLEAMNIDVKPSAQTASQSTSQSASTTSRVNPALQKSPNDKDSLTAIGNNKPENAATAPQDQDKLPQTSIALATYSVIVSLLAIALGFLCLRLWKAKRKLEMNQNRQTDTEVSNVAVDNSLDIIGHEGDLARYKALQEYVNQQRRQHPDINQYLQGSALSELMARFENNLFSPSDGDQSQDTIGDSEIKAAIDSFQKQLADKTGTLHANNSGVAPLYPH